MNIILKNKRIILLFLFLISAFFSFSQGKSRRDSLISAAARTSSDSLKSDIYLRVARDEILSNPKMALVDIQKSLQLYSLKNGFPYLRYQNKMTAMRLLGQVDSSIYYCNLVLNQALRDNKPVWIADSYGEFGLISITQNNFSKAIEYFNKQLATIKKNKLTHPYSGVYNNIGIAYGNKGDWDMASEYFNRATRDDILNNRQTALGNDYNNLGIVSIVKEKPDSARKYFQLSLDYKRITNDVLGIGGSINNLALLEQKIKNYPKALILADSAYKIATANGFKKLQVEIYDTYDQIYSAMGDYKTAYEYLNKKNQLNSLFEKEEYTTKVQQLESNIELEQKQSLLLEKDLQLTKSEQQKQKQVGIIILGAVLVGALLLFLINFFRNNKILRERNSIIVNQKNLLEEKHKDITDSINYAQKIQSALIMSEEMLSKNVKEAFVIFKPRNVVSGDFYWFTEYKGRKILALADCTGHGVPGAFMSMIGITLLNQVVKEKGITSPAQILNNMRKEVIAALSIDGSDKRDGMDMAIISFNDTELIFAGANSSAILVENNSVTELKPNKQPIGSYEKHEEFTEQKINITPNSKIYLFSDGIVDQFGGPAGKKVKVRQFKEWLASSMDLSLIKQKDIIEGNLNKWKDGFDQTDDISLIGIKLS
ncbi:MAG: SpoIIE family protein phosphatase [Bacteroidetes bacterium]|nr:SpoIIE family protein phosphatase [Bacteroidota bacterium]